MPAIHVIFDPNDKINVQPEMVKRTGACVAVMTLSSKQIRFEVIQEIANRLATALLTAIAEDQGVERVKDD